MTQAHPVGNNLVESDKFLKEAFRKADCYDDLLANLMQMEKTARYVAEFNKMNRLKTVPLTLELP